MKMNGWCIVTVRYRNVCLYFKWFVMCWFLVISCCTCTYNYTSKHRSDNTKKCSTHLFSLLHMLWLGGFSCNVYRPTYWSINSVLPTMFAVLLLHEQVIPALTTLSTTSLSPHPPSSVLIQDQRNESRPSLCLKEDSPYQVRLFNWHSYLCVTVDVNLSNYLFKNQHLVMGIKNCLFTSSALGSFFCRLFCQ